MGGTTPAVPLCTMTGREFVGALEKHGFTVRRRCKSFVWLLRGEQSLMVDEDSMVPETFLERLLGSVTTTRHSRAPLSAGRRTSRSSQLGLLGTSPRETPKA